MYPPYLLFEVPLIIAKKNQITKFREIKGRMKSDKNREFHAERSEINNTERPLERVQSEIRCSVWKAKGRRKV